jgi:hypothetical protein
MSAGRSGWLLCQLPDNTCVSHSFIYHLIQLRNRISPLFIKHTGHTLSPILFSSKILPYSNLLILVSYFVSRDRHYVINLESIASVPPSCGFDFDLAPRRDDIASAVYMDHRSIYVKHDSDNCECCLDFWLGPQPQVRSALHHPFPRPCSACSSPYIILK